MSETFYSEDHEWITRDGDEGTVGITHYAQEQLGDVVFVEITGVGNTVEKGDEVGVIESVKTASEIYSPVSGEILSWNEALSDAPETVNSSPNVGGWLFKIKLSDPEQLKALMSQSSYDSFIEGLG